MLEDRIQQSKKMLIEFALFVEDMIEKGVKGLRKKDQKLLKEVIEKDEPRSNKLEVELDEFCTQVIAQFEPKAKNLRTLLMILKMNNGLERMGDLAENFCRNSLFLIERPSINSLTLIQKMGKEAINMLKGSINSFMNENVKLAEDVCKKDNIVDDLKDQVLRELIPIMSEDPTSIERAIRIIKLTRHLERIADLSTNICEDVVFVVEGRVIKHCKE